jgi:hypothetical protein
MVSPPQELYDRVILYNMSAQSATCRPDEKDLLTTAVRAPIPRAQGIRESLLAFDTVLAALAHCNPLAVVRACCAILSMPCDL